MNIFFPSVVIDADTSLVNSLIEIYKPEQCYVSYARTEEYKNIKGCIVSETYSHEDMLSANYSGYKFSDTCPPIDERLLKAMSEYEAMIMKIMERTNANLQVIKKENITNCDMEYEERVRLYHNHLRYWSHMLDCAKIGMVIYIIIPHDPVNLLIYYLCKIKNIAIAMSSYISVAPEFRYFTKDFTDPCPQILTTYERLALQLEKTPVEDITIIPNEMQQVYELYSGRNDNKTYTSKKSKIMSRVRRKGLAFVMKEACKIITKESIPRIKNKRLFKIYNSLSIQADFNKRYIFFPLHHQPELTTNPLGGVFVHQYLAISMLSFHLPTDVYIYIKEHPNQKSYGREKSLYYDLVKLPNVKLVHSSTDTHLLTAHCLAVASITGTAGFEGLFMEKPFLMFGYGPYMYSPGTFNIRNNEDCKKALDYILNKGVKHTLKDLKIYMKAMGEELRYCLYNRNPIILNEKLISLKINYDENIKELTAGYVQVLDEQLGIKRV